MYMHAYSYYLKSYISRALHLEQASITAALGVDDERWDNEINTSELQAEFIQQELDAQEERVRSTKSDPGLLN